MKLKPTRIYKAFTQHPLLMGVATASITWVGIVMGQIALRLGDDVYDTMIKPIIVAWVS